MHVKCSAVIDNPDERELFIKKVKCLGVKMNVVGTYVYAEYLGYNNGLYTVLVNTFEEQTRHTINVIH